MKRFFTSLFLLVFVGASLFAQAPEKFTYQAVVRNANNSLVINSPVGVRVSILQGGVNGTLVYMETQTSVTNDNGLITLQIGSGNVQQGNFADIDWAVGSYFLKTETDPNGGSNYSITSTQQLLSVPYALYAKDAGNGFSGDYNDLTNTPQIPTVPTNVSAFTNDAGYLTSFTEQQILTISHDTIFLTGGSFVKLPSGFDGDYNSLTNTPNLSAVATSGSYSDLTGTPTIPTVPTNVSAFANDAGYLTSYTEQQVLTISHDTVFLTGGSFVKLPAGFDGDYNSLTNTPNLAAVATSGSYSDLSGTPDIPTVPTNVSTFTNDAGYLTAATVQAAVTIPTNVSAFTNDAGYLTAATVQDAVTIPTNVCAYTNDAGYITLAQVPAQVNADWNATEGAAQILNKPTIPAAANNATLTIQQNGTVLGTFTADASADQTINVTVPTQVSQLTNDSGYITAGNIPTNISAYTNDAGYITSAQCGDVTICDMANLITSLQSMLGQLQSQLGQMQSRMDALTGETVEP
jgi:hypothetical protein